MLFDLRGRRRRAVQATYLTLAVLMGGGLVFFGIGGSVGGGLLDAFKGGSGSSQSGNSALQKRVDSNKAKLRRNPQSIALTQVLMRDEFQLAGSQVQQGATSYPKDARDELAAAGGYWQRYLKLQKGNPNADLARIALQVYDPNALNKPKDAQNAAQIVAQADNDAASYLRLVQYSTLAGDKRTADLAAKKAVDLAPKGQRKTVQLQAKQFKNPQAVQPQG
jgi:hypothetical protein